MSEPRVTVGQDEAGAGRGEKEAKSAPLKQPSSEASRPGQLGLPPGSQLPSTEPSPSPSAEGSGLLSLPWEMVARIASHLPAQCVITVLPQVCHALGNVGKDSTAWQLRARRLTGPRASFPVGPRDGFDWPSACLEMEELIACWTGQGERAAREAEQAERERERLSLPSGHIAEVNSVLLVGGDGALCASGSRDRNVNLWDLRDEGSTGRLLHTLGGQGLFSTHKGWVWCLAARGPLLASGSFDSTVRLWDLGAQGAERGLIRARAAVLCLALPQKDVLLAGTYDKKVSVYDTRVAEPLVKSLRLHSNAVLCLVADEQYILSGSKDRTVVIYDRRAGKTLQKLQLGSYLLSMCYSDSEVWAGDNRGILHAFSMQAGFFKPLSQFDVGHTSLVTGIHRSPGSLYTCSADRTIKVHLPCAPPRTLCTLHHQAGVNGLSVEAGVLAIASGEMCVEVWRARR
ncbi:unnamed protein product [Oncorhynchus mykiss]|uniref:Uncharacterized protein n=1 Tax=Oncorhynchus mykiss TaxID=8022 RepID=A0A060Y592_ONCMY|nr:unnamed protein product [Oncorhynchus mykiss]